MFGCGPLSGLRLAQLGRSVAAGDFELLQSADDDAVLPALGNAGDDAVLLAPNALLQLARRGLKKAGPAGKYRAAMMRNAKQKRVASANDRHEDETLHAQIRHFNCPHAKTADEEMLSPGSKREIVTGKSRWKVWTPHAALHAGFADP